MATDNPGNDPEEDKNLKNSNSDDDFGLPDMEYDELDDDDDDDDDSSDSDSFDSGVDDYNSTTSDDDFKSDFSSKGEDDNDDILSSTDEIDFSTDYNTDYSKSSTSSDLESDYNGDSEYSSEDFSEFEPSENADLPGNYRTFSSESGGKSITKFIVIGVIVAFLLAAGLLYMQSILDENKSSSKIVKVEKTTPEPVAQDPDPEPIVEEPVEEKQEPVTTTPAKPTPSPVVQKPQPVANNNAEFTGSATTLRERTGRAYIVAGSFFDEDMASDYCKKLISQGITSPFIIPPFNDTKFYRVAIADFGTYKEAADAIAQYQESYGQDIWALKY
jgi:hypothetical protein